MFAESVRKAVQWVRSLDAKTVLIFVLLVSDAAHAGRLFAVREVSDRALIGYVLAFAIDGVLAVSLYELATVRKRAHRAFALGVFLLACAVSGGFNVAYYRGTMPSDPWSVSILLGATAPTLAACLSVMKAFDDSGRAEAERAESAAARSLELEKYRIEQAERTRREHLTAQERTKQVRARARAERAQAEASVQTTERGNGHKADGGNGRVRPGELDAEARVVLLERPDIGPRPLARELGCSPSTASGILKRLNGNGQEAVA